MKYYCNYQGSLHKLMDNILTLKELFENEKCQLLSTSVEELLKYKCCCESEDIHEITYQNFVKGIRCNGYSCRRAITTPPTTKVCINCGFEKPIDAFAPENCSRNISTHKNTCRKCKNGLDAEYRNTQGGYLKNLVKNAKLNSKRRSEDRPDAGTFDITYDDILEMWKSQQGRCYYSNVPLKTVTKADFQTSIERLDTEKGYEKDNVVLCALEFNDTIQWSKEKVIEMIKLLQDDHDFTETDFTFTKKQPVKFQRAVYDKAIYHQCNKCFEVKLLNQFNKNKSTGCKPCVKMLDQQRIDNPRSSLLLMLKTARSNCKKRADKSHLNERDCTFDIELSELIEIYRKQKGLCAYSNLPLCFGNSKDINWKISLERKDVKQGYKPDNVCLICYEFNTGDKTILYNDSGTETGCCGWSPEKFKIVLASCREFYHKELNC